MQQSTLFIRFGVALAIGMLIGLERERSHAHKDATEATANEQANAGLFAGVRTFALLGILGAIAALITTELQSALPVSALLMVLGLLTAIAYLIKAWRNDVGLTTEVSLLITVTCGMLCAWGYLALASAIGVATVLLLSFKLEMHQFARRITQQDIYATLKFAVISVVILPVLPNQSFAPPPFDLLNPYRLWLMVVLISGISFLGYLLMKVLRPQQGIGLTGLLGGLVSSTAVTASFSQRSRLHESLSPSFALAIIAAWTVMFMRVMIEVAAVNPALLQRVWIPLTASAVVGLGYSGFLYLRQPSQESEEIVMANPFELGPAIQFGLLYAVILLVSRAATLYLGNTGLYLSSIASGLVDVDAITLSVANLARDPQSLDSSTAGRAIIFALLSNTCVKEGILLATGSAPLRRASLPGFLLILAVGIITAWWL